MRYFRYILAVAILGVAGLCSANEPFEPIWAQGSHFGIIYDLDLSPDGSKLVSAGANESVKVWDTRTNELLRTFFFPRTSTTGSSNIWEAAFANDGDHIIVSSYTGIFVLRYSTGQVVRSFPTITSAGYVHLAVHPSAPRFAVATDRGYFQEFDYNTGVETRRFEFSTGIHSELAYSPDGTMLAAVHEGALVVYDATSGQTIFQASDGNRSLTFTNDGRYLVLSDAQPYQSYLRVYDTTSWQVTQSSARHVRRPRKAVALGENMIITCSEDSTMKVWSAPSASLIATMNESPLSFFMSATVTPDNSKIIAAVYNTSSGAPKLGYWISAWDTATMTKSYDVTMHNTDPVPCISSDGETMAVGSNYPLYRVIDARNGRLKHILTDNVARMPVHFALNDQIIFERTLDAFGHWAGDFYRRTMGWDNVLPVGSNIWVLDVSPIANEVATSNNRSILVLSIPSMEVVRSVDTGNVIFKVLYSPDGDQLIVRGGGSSTKVYDASTLLLMYTIPNTYDEAVIFSADGNYIYAPTTFDGLGEYRASDGVLLRSFGADTRDVDNALVSADGKTLVASKDRNYFAFVDLQSGTVLGRIGVNSTYLAFDYDFLQFEDGDLELFADRGDGTVALVANPFKGTTIGGTLALQDFIGETAAQEISYELYDVQGMLLHTWTRPITQYGNWKKRVPTLAEGEYTLRAKAAHWLAQSVPFTLESRTNVQFNLVNGDIDGDNEVGPGDFGALAEAFLAVPGDANWNLNADLDGDNEVGPSDFAVLAQNFLMSGD